MSSPSSTEVSALIEGARKRADAATPGPWKAVSDGHESAILGVCNPYSIRIVVESENHHRTLGYRQNRGGVVTQDDAEFIASARQDVPALCDTLESFVRQREELLAYCRESAHGTNHCDTIAAIFRILGVNSEGKP